MNKKKLLKIGLVCAIAVLIVVLSYVFLDDTDTKDQNEQEHTNIEEADDNKFPIPLDFNLQITLIDSYTGPFMEDGTDESVEDILSIVVENTGDKAIQYAEILMSSENEEAVFSLSTLLPGESMLVLEKNRMSYKTIDAFANILTNNVAVFNEAPILYEDKFSIQKLDGALNVTNISEEDIAGDIYIYYKNKSSDMYCGGITYRAKIADGLEASAIIQIMTNHFSMEDSEIMFVTIAGE